MAHWHLIAPDWASLDTIWRSPLPFILWPVCDKPLLSYWLDEAVRRGVDSVSIEALDRPHLIRQWLGQRDLWSRSIEVCSHPGKGSGKEVFFLEGLPGAARPDFVGSAKDLMHYWYGLQGEALRRRSSGMVHIDHEYQPGVWFAPGARAAADVAFTPPCWVGSHANIGRGCRIGPHAFIGPGAFLDSDVEVEESVVCADTYAGSHTSIKGKVVQGGLLIDLARGIAVDVEDEFVISAMGTSAPSWGERIVAALLGPPLELVSRVLNWGRNPVETVCRLSRSRAVSLGSYASGPLCLRRSRWLRQVAAGKMRMVGVLPRTEEDWAGLSPEVRSAIEQAPAGVFALSDLYHCHSPKHPDEWMHALFQAGSAAGAGHWLARKAVLKIAISNPIE